MKRKWLACWLMLCLAVSAAGCAQSEELSGSSQEGLTFSSWEELTRAVEAGSMSGIDHYDIPSRYQHLPPDVIQVASGYVSARYTIGDPTGAVYEGVEADEAELLTTTVTFVRHLGDGELFQLTLPFHEVEAVSGSWEWMSVERVDIS